METAGEIKALHDLESFSWPKKEWPEGNYSIVVTRTPDHSSVDLDFDTEKGAARLARRLHYPDNEPDLYEGDPATYQTWKALNRELGAPAKLLGPRELVESDELEGKFRLRIIANYETTNIFRDGAIKKMIAIGLIPDEVLKLLS